MKQSPSLLPPPPTDPRELQGARRGGKTFGTSLLIKQVLLVILLPDAGRDSSAGIATLRAGWSGNRIPMEAIFSASVGIGPGAHTPSYTLDTGSHPGVKRPGRGVNYLPHLVPRLKKD